MNEKLSFEEARDAEYLIKLQKGEELFLPASANKPPQESLRDYLPEYLRVARENSISEIRVNCGQISFDYNISKRALSNFALSGDAGNVDMMEKLTENVLVEL